MKTAFYRGFLTRFLPAAVILIFLGGCANVPVYEQGLVSKVGMTRTDSMVQGDRVNLLPQIEPGSAISGGSVAAGCTVCR